MNKILSLIIILTGYFTANAAVYTVNVNTDAGTGTALTGDLRYCITQANLVAGPHTIQFAIAPVGSVATITLTNDLPNIIMSNITINGHTQTGNTNVPGVILVRTGGNNGFNINVNPPASVANVTIRGFIIQGFQNGVNVRSATSIKIYGCWINVNAAGTAATAGGQYGINLDQTSYDTIGAAPKGQRNIILACSINGINTTNTAVSHLVIKNNFIGILPNGTGSAATGVTQHGIDLNGAPYCTIGGTLSMERNVIAWTGANGDAILVDPGSHHVKIIGNLIGTDSTGTIAYGIGKEGVFVQANPPTTVSTAPTINYNVIAKCGTGAVPGAYGIHITSTDSATIKGNKIGVNINGAGAGFGNTIAGVYISNQVAGVNSKGHLIGGTTALDRNIISNNGKYAALACSNLPDGIVFENVSFSKITGNYIGTDVTGLIAMGNSGSGILLQTGTTDVTIGGLTAAERNVICDNGFACTGVGGRHGIQLYGSNVTNIFIQGNYIGVGANGTTAMGNSIDGVSILLSVGNTVGGTTAAAGNIISANTYGVHIQGSGAFPSTDNNVVLNNYIGTDFTGTIAKGNTKYGVLVDNGAGSTGTSNYIGKPGQGNLISGNLWAGIAMMAAGNGSGTGSQNTFVYANTIGLSSSGAPLANDTGIVIKEGAHNNFIGSSTAAGATNIIAYNTNNGLWISGASTNKNWISKNSFYCNGNSYAASDVHNKGINLNGTGNNNYSTPPVVYSNVLPAPPNSDANNLRGTATANSIVEIFQVETCVTCPATGGVSIEGMTYVTTVNADAAGSWIWTPGGALGGSYTVTATEPASAGTYRNTSEFSTCGFINLPVTWLSFNAYKSGSNVNVLWATASEKNNGGFIVEKSTDGITFSEIGRVNGAGTSEDQHNYLFTDTEPGSGIIYYRLKQTDVDGKINYSAITSVNISGNDIVRVFPVPTEGALSIQFLLKAKSSYVLEIFSIPGNSVFYSRGNTENEFYEKKIDISHLPSGMYLLNVTTDAGRSVIKITKE
jgi:hypothetical protein